MTPPRRSGSGDVQDPFEALRRSPRRWLVTGVAGFIGSNLLETLLSLDQTVTGLDDFTTGSPENLDDVKRGSTPERWSRFSFIEGDVADLEMCLDVCRGVDIVLHQAALGSVPRSIATPAATHRANATGTLLMLMAAVEHGVARFVYASSSSVYGDVPDLPKVESRTGRVLSPYAASKVAAEAYAVAMGSVHGLELIGLRYFNVFGPRQDPGGAYAAVIPRWIGEMIRGDEVTIFGDGETTRDFCYVANAVRANLLAGTTSNRDAFGSVYNVAVGERTSLNELLEMIRERVARTIPAAAEIDPVYVEPRPGDVRHSLAEIERARRDLGYEPTHTLAGGLDQTVPWYLERFGERAGDEVGTEDRR